jgi:hypothetical protein
LFLKRTVDGHRLSSQAAPEDRLLGSPVGRCCLARDAMAGPGSSPWSGVDLEPAQEIQQLYDDHLPTLPGVQRLSSILVMKSVFENRALPL